MTGSFKIWVSERIAQFCDDTRGATAIVFAGLALPVLGLGLAAVDYATAQGSKAAIQDAADAAARAGAKMLGAPHSDIEDAVRGYLKTNLPQNRNELPFELSFAPEDKALTIKMSTTVATSVLGIVGIKELDLAIESTAERPDPIKELQAPHPGLQPGIAPELPPEIARQFPGLDRHISPEELRNAEAMAKQVLSELERNGGSAEVQKLLRTLQDLR